MRLALAAAAFVLSAAAADSALAADVTGAGSTFVYPILAQWAASYKKQTGTDIHYEANGSGLGIEAIKQRKVTFGASDMPLKPTELDADGLIQFPTVVGGDVPVVNLAGVKPGQMTLDGPALANIFLGKITRWDDPAIKKLNPNINLPALAIAVVHRSDGSGTTFIWANYLSQVSREWAGTVGAGTTIAWPVGVGCAGNEGVSKGVAETPGAIGYVEFAYAMQHHLTYTKVVNLNGRAVPPSLAAFQAAAVSANWAKAPNFYLVLTNMPGDETWPISGATFILVPRKPSDPAATAEALKFFQWAYENGDDMAWKLNYMSMPERVVWLIEASWKQIDLPPR